MYLLFISDAGQQVISDVLDNFEPDSGSRRHSEVGVPPTSPEGLPTLVKSQGARHGGALVLTPRRGTSRGPDACCTLTNLYYGIKVVCATWRKTRTTKKTTESSVLRVSDLSWPSFLWNYVSTQARVTPWGELLVQTMPMRYSQALISKIGVTRPWFVCHLILSECAVKAVDFQIISVLFGSALVQHDIQDSFTGNCAKQENLCEMLPTGVTIWPIFILFSEIPRYP